MNGIAERAFELLVEAIVGPRIKISGVYRYRVVAQSGMTVDAEPVSTTLGLPPVAKVQVRGSIPGFSLDIEPGTECVLGFLDGDPAQPYVLSFDQTGSGDVGRAIREGDHIMMPVGQPPVLTATPVALSQPGATVSPVALTEPGAPGTGYSRVKL